MTYVTRSAGLCIPQREKFEVLYSVGLGEWLYCAYHAQGSGTREIDSHLCALLPWRLPVCTALVAKKHVTAYRSTRWLREDARGERYRQREIPGLIALRRVL